MSFISYDFFFYLPFFFILFILTPLNFRWLLLSCTGFVFYSIFSLKYAFLFLSISFINYFFGIAIEKSSLEYRNKIYYASLLLNISILVVFKLVSETEINTTFLSNFFHLNYPETILNVLYPLGLSYFIFSSLSYLIDIKRNKILAEKNIGILLSYFLFFPKLIQGPIERVGNIIPQLKTKLPINYINVTSGMKLIALGYFKKLIIADRLSVFVNSVYADPSALSSITLILATVFFAVQIYCDFSGYSDIAVGVSRIMGISIIQNFNRPYFSTSIKEFWNRWHISLSVWFRDYLFLPISYYLSNKLRHESYMKIKTEKIIYVVAITLTFTICGIWHGLSWNYFIWGSLFALYLSSAMLFRKNKIKLLKKIQLLKYPNIYYWSQIFFTFTLVLFAWIFFRSKTPLDAFTIIKGILFNWSFEENISNIFTDVFHHGLPKKSMLIALFSISFLFFIEFLSEKIDILERLSRLRLPIRWAIYFLFVISIIIFSVSGNNQFIYNQF